MTRRVKTAVILAVALTSSSACGWQGANSLPLPGTQGHGAGSFTVEAQLPDVDNIERNSRVRVGDVTIGRVTKIELQGWHALVTMQLNPGTELPANSTAKIGQTSLLGSKHIELAPPVDVPREGLLHNGSLIPLSSGSTYPTTERTLAAVSMLLNGGGLGQLQDITHELSTAFSGRENDLRSLIEQLSRFASYLNEQVDDIIAATESLNALAGQFADQKPVMDRALDTIPAALAVLKDERHNLADSLDSLGEFSALAADSVNQTDEHLVAIFNELGPVLQSLGDAGPALTRSLSVLSTFPWVKENLSKWMRGDLANLDGVFDFTLSRIDQWLFTGTRWEGDLTELELQWGRTVGQLPSPYSAGNPLTAPYHFNQGG